MMQHTAQPTDEPINTLLKVVHSMERATILPREAVTDVCPVCLRPVIVRNCEVICVSGMCRYRLIESCSGG